MKFVTSIKSIPKQCISDFDCIKESFVSHSSSDFTRDRKFPFSTMLEFILCMEGGTLKSKLFKYLGLTISFPTSSTFV